MKSQTSLLSFLWQEWQNPSAAYRGKPFWSWNGRLDPIELIRQIGVFKEMGMGGYFMHSRTGLQTRYLGREWFDCINACTDAGQALGLESWLYDEDRWPSGSAGGLATKELRHRMKYLRLTVQESGGTDEWPAAEHFVAAFSARVRGLDLGPCRRVEHGARAADGQQLLVFSWEYMGEHSFYNDTAYLDTMDRAATDNFLRVTHDAYRDACGDRLGTGIRGIFTDEPHRGFVFCSSHGQPGVPDPGWATPWTHGLPEAFIAAFGYDLVDRLPELFLRPEGQRLSPVKWAYMEICQRLFLQNWAQPMHERCGDLGLLLTGHVLHENSLAAQAVPCGSMMRYYPYLDYPGIDILGSRNECHWVVKQLSSVARQFERPWMLSELYGCTGWQTDFMDHKRIGDWQALFGINVRCHHLSWYSMAGEAKRDFPASISFQSAWYLEYAAVETYFSRLHVMLKAGRPVCDVLVINPVESTWAQIHVNWAKWLQTTDPDVEAIEETYAEVFAALAGAQIDFDYGDEGHLAEHGSVDAADATLQLRAMRYGVVVVAGMETLRGTTLRLLRNFRDAGGKVIFAGTPPSHLDALPSTEPARFAADGPCVPVDGPVLAAMVREHSPAARQLTLGEEGEGLFCQVRTEGGACTVVLLNPSETRHYDNLTLRCRHAGPVTELDALTGQATVVEINQEEDGRVVRWETSFRPLQERVFLCGVEMPEAEPAPAAISTHRKTLDGDFVFSLDEPNLAVLDTAEFSVADGPWEPAREILRVEKALSERLGIPLRGGQMVQPWAREASATKEGTPLALRFRFEVEHLPESPVQLAIEQPKEFSITLNSRKIPAPSEDTWFIDPCLRTVTLPPDALQAGANTLELECRYREGVDLEAVYLLGAFGVRTGPGSRVRLTELPARLGVGDWTQCGLPFYSGRICLQMPVGEANRLALSPVGAATLVVRNPASGQSRILPWAPFECDLDGLSDPHGFVEVEWILTRRNTFGPLHLIPVEQPAIGPAHFRSEGEEWSDDYQFIPVGLKEPPAIES